MPLTFFIFFAVAQLILTLGHIVIAKVFIVGVGATGWFASLIWWKLFILSFYFTAMSVLVRFADNKISRFFYRISAIWLGFFVNIFMVAALYGLVLWLFTDSVSAQQLILITTTVFIIPILFSVYGLLNAFRTVVTRYEVALPHLPLHWKGKKIVFISDTHFGQVRGEGSARAWAAIIEAEKPDILLHGGDFYDGVKTNAEAAAGIFGKIKSAYGIYGVTGNHESFEDDTFYINVLQKNGVRVLNDDAVNVEGLIIAGARYKTNEDRKLFEASTHTLVQKVAELKQKDGLGADSPVVFIKHVPDNMDITAKLGNVLQLSGHTHRGQLWPYRFLTRPIFKGFDYGYTKAGEVQEITSSGLGTWGPPLRTFTKSEVVVIRLI